MRKRRKSATKLLLATIVLTATMSMTAYAGEWQKDEYGWKYQKDDGTYIENGSQWIENGGEYLPDFYFFENGYSIGTPLKTEKEIEKQKEEIEQEKLKQESIVRAEQDKEKLNIPNTEIVAAVERAKTAGAGSYQDSYSSGEWKDVKTYTRNDDTKKFYWKITGKMKRASKDVNGMIVSPTNGIVAIAEKEDWRYDYPAAGADKSIRLATDPANGNLQPNWLYNPLGKTMTAPPVICMDKNTYHFATWTEVTQDYETGLFYYKMDTCDTSGSWVFNPNPTGTIVYAQGSRGGQLSGWMYRFADGSYAANGGVYIYDGCAVWDSNANNLEGAFVSGQLYFFNENGFLVTNTIPEESYLDEYGRVCDGTAGPYGQSWYYTR